MHFDRELIPRVLCFVDTDVDELLRRSDDMRSSRGWGMLIISGFAFLIFWPDRFLDWLEVRTGRMKTTRQLVVLQSCAIAGCLLFVHLGEGHVRGVSWLNALFVFGFALIGRGLQEVVEILFFR